MIGLDFLGFSVSSLLFPCPFDALGPDCVSASLLSPHSHRIHKARGFSFLLLRSIPPLPMAGGFPEWRCLLARPPAPSPISYASATSRVTPICLHCVEPAIRTGIGIALVPRHDVSIDDGAWISYAPPRCLVRNCPRTCTLRSVGHVFSGFSLRAPRSRSL